jgi:hypothetical protein
MSFTEEHIFKKIIDSGGVLTKVNDVYLFSGTEFRKAAEILLSRNIKPLTVTEVREFILQDHVNSSTHVKSFLEQINMQNKYNPPHFRTFAGSIQGPDGSIKLLKNIFDYFTPEDLYKETTARNPNYAQIIEQFENIPAEKSLHLGFQEIRLLEGVSRNYDWEIREAAKHHNWREIRERILDFFEVQQDSRHITINLNPYKKIDTFSVHKEPKITKPEFICMYAIGVGVHEGITAKTQNARDDKPLLFRIHEEP